MRKWHDRDWIPSQDELARVSALGQQGNEVGEILLRWLDNRQMEFMAACGTSENPRDVWLNQGAYQALQELVERLSHVEDEDSASPELPEVL